MQRKQAILQDDLEKSEARADVYRKEAEEKAGALDETERSVVSLHILPALKLKNSHHKVREFKLWYSPELMVDYVTIRGHPPNMMLAFGGSVRCEWIDSSALVE